MVKDVCLIVKEEPTDVVQTTEPQLGAPMEKAVQECVNYQDLVVVHTVTFQQLVPITLDVPTHVLLVYMDVVQTTTQQLEVPIKRVV